MCALRALFKNDLLFFTGASARKFLVSRAWSCVVRRIPSGKLMSNLSRVASLFGRKDGCERLAPRGVFLHSFLELSSYTIMGAGGRSEGVGPIDEPDSSAWLPVCGVSVCQFCFSTLATSKRSKFNIVTASSGEHICPKMEEEKGPGW